MVFTNDGGSYILMHEVSYNMMKGFVEQYLQGGSVVLDVGGSDINGSYRKIIEDKDSKYITLDWENADIIVKDYQWDIKDNTFDAVISGQTFEHDGRFWLTLENIKRVVKPGGLVMLIMPSKGFYHAFPIDCYRFYPDSSKVFAEILQAEILEVIWNNEYMHFPDKPAGVKYDVDTYWGDLGMVFKLW